MLSLWDIAGVAVLVLVGLVRGCVGLGCTVLDWIVLQELYVHRGNCSLGLSCGCIVLLCITCRLVDKCKRVLCRLYVGCCTFVSGVLGSIVCGWYFVACTCTVYCILILLERLDVLLLPSLTSFYCPLL